MPIGWSQQPPACEKTAGAVGTLRGERANVVGGRSCADRRRLQGLFRGNSDILCRRIYSRLRVINIAGDPDLGRFRPRVAGRDTSNQLAGLGRYRDAGDCRRFPRWRTVRRKRRERDWRRYRRGAMSLSSSTVPHGVSRTRVPLNGESSAPIMVRAMFVGREGQGPGHGRQALPPAGLVHLVGKRPITSRKPCCVTSRMRSTIGRKPPCPPGALPSTSSGFARRQPPRRFRRGCTKRRFR